MIGLMAPEGDEQRQARLKGILREIVEKLGSQQAAAEALGVRQPRISQILARGERITDKMLFSMATYTGRTVSDLVGEFEPAAPSYRGEEAVGAALRAPREVTAEVHPRLRDLEDWRYLVAGAHSRAAERNRPIPEWAWAALANTAPALTVPPTVVDIYELACFFADHGWGRPLAVAHEVTRARAVRPLREPTELRPAELTSLRGAVDPHAPDERDDEAHEEPGDEGSEGEEPVVKSGMRTKFEAPSGLAGSIDSLQNSRLGGAKGR